MFKDPDGVYDSLVEAGVRTENGEIADEKAKALVDKYVEFDEYIYIEFDTEAGTVTILEAD